MKVLIAGTPLESLVWQREVGKVKIKFREDIDDKTKLEFLNDFLVSVREELRLNW